jgi:cell division protein FtsZ
MGIGSARGEDRAVQAAELAISSPLLEASIDGAHGVLLSIQGGSDLGLFEINEAARLVQEAAHPEANIIFGTVIDDALGDEVRVTVIAAGFDGGGPMRRTDERALGQVAGSTQRPTPTAVQPPRVGQPAPQVKPPLYPGQPPAGTPVQPGQLQAAGSQPQPVHPPAPEPVPVAVARPPRTVTFDDNDDLDVPDFLK